MNVVALPEGYGSLLEQLKNEIRSTRVQAHRVVNAEMLRLYWSIGTAILQRQASEGWGAKVIDRLADDLRAEFPTMKGLGRSSVHYMRAFAVAWPDGEIVQQPAGQLPWGHVMVLLDKLGDRSERDWYATQGARHGWSRAVLEHQIATGLRQRIAAAPSNFAAQLSPPDSDLAQQLVKDPYVFDFLNLTDRVAERDLEQALMSRLQDVLLEFGRGFAFVGRQVHFDVDGDDFYVDMVLFHVLQLRYVVVELKIGKFKPDYVGQLGFYVSLVDDVLREPGVHAPTIGILLCRSRNERVVRYALGGSTSALAVANYTYDTLPPEQRRILPTADTLAAALDGPITVAGRQVDIDEYFPPDEPTSDG